MLFKYKCACCDHVLTSQDKECTQCGSQHIKSPIHLWVFAAIACLIAVSIFKIGQVYLQDQNDAPTQKSFFSVIEQGKSKVNE